MMSASEMKTLKDMQASRGKDLVSRFARAITRIVQHKSLPLDETLSKVQKISLARGCAVPHTVSNRLRQLLTFDGDARIVGCEIVGKKRFAAIEAATIATQIVAEAHARSYGEWRSGDLDVIAANKLPPMKVVMKRKPTVIDIIKVRYAVYFLLLNGCVVYVGKSINLQYRLEHHFKDKPFTEIRLLKFRTERAMAEAERIYIEALRPALNKQFNAAFNNEAQDLINQAINLWAGKHE